MGFRSLLVVACAAGFSLSACGLELNGLGGIAVEDGGTAASSSSSSGGATGSTGSSSGATSDPVDASVSCAASAGCTPAPDGWTFVAFASNQSAACPTGFSNAPPTDCRVANGGILHVRHLLRRDPTDLRHGAHFDVL